MSVSAGTLVIGSQRINYGASSSTVDGEAGSTVRIYLYYFDPNLNGGTLPLHLTTDIVASANEDGRVAISFVDLTFPAAGSSGSGGGGIGGGGGSGGAGSCPWIGAWVIERVRGAIYAGQVVKGDWLLGLNGAWVEVTYSERATVPGECITNASGHNLTCSATAPILTNSGFVPAVYLDECHVVDVTGDGPLPIADVIDVGLIEVQHISCAGTWNERVFLVGDDRRFLFPHHNLKQVDTGL